MTTKVIFLTSGTTIFPVPSDWNDADNTIEAIAGGQAGGAASAGGRYGGGGGGGGAYTKLTNVSLTPGGNIPVQIGQGGVYSSSATGYGQAGTDTWFDSTSTLFAQGAGSSGNSGG